MGAARGARGRGVIYEVFRQERKGVAFEHAGSVAAPDEGFARAYAHEQYGRRGESVALWVVPREAVLEVEDFVDELGRNYHRVDGYVPQIWELGLSVPDPKLRKNEDGVWEYTEPDWDELKSVVTGHGPCTTERLEFRRISRDETEWVRSVMLAEAA